jgi:hypothetical protein
MPTSDPVTAAVPCTPTSSKDGSGGACTENEGMKGIDVD